MTTRRGIFVLHVFGSDYILLQAFYLTATDSPALGPPVFHGFSLQSLCITSDTIQRRLGYASLSTKVERKEISIVMHASFLRLTTLLRLTRLYPYDSIARNFGIF